MPKQRLAIGQIWLDRDGRRLGSYVEIIKVHRDIGYVECYRFDPKGNRSNRISIIEMSSLVRRFKLNK